MKKIILHPIQYIEDSPWFKTDNLKINRRCKNIFIVSHLGQLKQVESLILKEKIESSLLIIVYTKKNLRVPQSIQSQYNKTLFVDSILFLLPNNPNNYKLKSLIYMKRNYKYLIEKIKPKNLYLLSFENHYCLLANVAISNNIKLILIDEGTATYKEPNLSAYHKEHSFFRKIIAKIFGVDSSFNRIKNFDTVYGAFPKLLEPLFYANSYKYFFAYENTEKIEGIVKLSKIYNITHNDFIYVNQRYPIQEEDFVNTLLTILDTISKFYNSNIFIKMHPKDSEELKAFFFNALVNYSNIFFIKENEFLIEPSIKEINPKGIIGLTSTTLVYTPFISINTSKIYSIVPWFLELLPKENNQKAISILKNHYTILEKFNHIKSLYNEESLNE